MSRLLLIPLDDTVVFPGMSLTLAIDAGEEERVLLVPRHGQEFANVGTVAEVVFRTNTRDDFFSPSDSFVGWGAGTSGGVTGGGGGVIYGCRLYASRAGSLNVGALLSAY